MKRSFGMLMLAAGCATETVPAGVSEVDGPTWHGEIAPLLAEHCGSCHTEGALAGFLPLLDYPVAAPMADVIALQAATREMPPFMADDGADCENPWGFMHDPRLSNQEIQLLADWAAADAPLGDPQTAAPLPAPPSFGLEDGNQELVPPNPYVTSLENGADEFICVTLDLGLEETGYLTGIEVVPDFDEVVHHATVSIDRDGSTAALGGDDNMYPCFGGTMSGASTFIAAWIPGAPPTVPPHGASWVVEPGARLVVQLHYHPTGIDQADQTRYRLRWADGPTPDRANVTLIGNDQRQMPDGSGLQPGEADDGGPRFLIPANSPDHTERIRWDVPDNIPEASVWLVLNHMHYIGAGMKVWVEHADGSEDSCLLNTPRWDFNWQQGFYYDAAAGAAPTLKGGDTLWLECSYDNTLDNPGVRRALSENGLEDPQDVTIGESSLDEMCMVGLGVVF
ncbi:MAG: hypothetical protein AAFV53_20640 [Myxococcota bacterium]